MPLLKNPPGIIPARAGFTLCEPDAPRAQWDHPRSRGVYTGGTMRISSGRGSSPLARGLRGTAYHYPCRVGIIPARAGFTSRPSPRASRPRDHPRSRGVYARAGRGGGGGGGSSPLARGLHVLAGGAGCDNGIIPARAGFTRRPPGRPRHAPDHPRSRGVYPRPPRGPPSRRGSSPLARGLLRRRPPRGDPARIIPARAGFTPIPRRRIPAIQDHPRSRGVYPDVFAATYQETGSSPLARGLQVGQVAGADGVGIIPARAGFTEGYHGVRSPDRDHPRSRGVYPRSMLTSCPVRGSSPLARGLLRAALAARAARRIIPARAGFTRRRPSSVGRPRDHPRSRGVYTALAVGMRLWVGSSPLARGLRLAAPATRARPRIIPARAGFTMCGSAATAPSPDHPRSRGVYDLIQRWGQVVTGSSPLARGLPPWTRASSRAARIIPARAGFTPRSWPSRSATRDHPRSRGVYG